MHDNNGRPTGIMSHEIKTDTSNANDEMVLALNKDVSSMKFNDKSSNDEILSYSNPRVMTNKESFLGDAVELADNSNTLTNTDTNSSDDEKFDISSLPNLQTGPTLM